MQTLALLVVALVPLLITPSLLSHYDVTPKIAFLSCGTALILLYSRTNVSNARKLFRAPAGRWFQFVLGAEWLALAIATGFSTNRALSLHGGTWRRFGFISETALLLFVLLVASWLARDKSNVRKLLTASTFAGATAATYGILQYFGVDPLLASSGYEVGDEPFRIVRPPGTLGHADYFGDWLVSVCFLAFALAATEKRPWRKWMAVSASLLMMLAIVLTGTRAALLGLLAGLLIFVAAKRVRTRDFAIGSAFLAGVAVLFFAPAGAKLRARLHWSIEDARGGARLPLWRDALQMAADRPVSGFGPETFSIVFPRFESLELARSYPDFYHESPHNIFLDTFAGEGLIGLAVLLSLCGLGAWSASKAWRSGHPLAAPLSAALAGLLVAQQFSVFVFTTSLYFHLLIALLVVAVLPQRSLSPEKAASPQSRWTLAMSLPVSLVLVLFATHLLIADHALAVAERRIAAEDAKGAANAYRSVLSWQLPGAGDDLAYSRAMQQLAERSPIFATKIAASQQALESAIRAVSNAEDRQNAWYNLATVLATRNDTAGVERALRNAIAWAPNWFKPHWTLAQVLELTNRHAEAVVEARAAVERDGNHDPEVAETWKKLHGSP